MARCNCENIKCGHTPGYCDKEAKFNNKILYLGNVCEECYKEYPEEYKVRLVYDDRR